MGAASFVEVVSLILRRVTCTLDYLITGVLVQREANALPVNANMENLNAS